MAQMERRDVDVVVIGGGQAGLAAGFYLRRAGYEFAILDANTQPGGAWRHTWPSLRLFSPASYSSLPGWRMPASTNGNPDAAHVIDYLTRYEQRYRLPVHRAVTVAAVHRDNERFRLQTDAGAMSARAIISATGTWSRPFWPSYPGQGDFRGSQIHSAHYDGPRVYRGRRVLVVGGANSGAQIAADLATECELTWCTNGPVRYLPDEVDGRELFRIATSALQGEGGGVGALGDVVAVPPVKQARDAGLLQPTPMFSSFTQRGVRFEDGDELDVDAVIWCTGFRPALRHLAPLGLRGHEGRIALDGTASVDVPGLYLLGYGEWTGPASATLIGVGRAARDTVGAIATFVSR